MVTAIRCDFDRIRKKRVRLTKCIEREKKSASGYQKRIIPFTILYVNRVRCEYLHKVNLIRMQPKAKIVCCMTLIPKCLGLKWCSNIVGLEYLMPLPLSALHNVKQIALSGKICTSVRKVIEIFSENISILIGLWLTKYDHNNRHFGESHFFFFSSFSAQKRS